MSAKPMKSAALLMTVAAFALTSAGCSSNPLCETDLSIVDSARGAASSAESDLDAAKSQKSQLQGKIDSETGRKTDLEVRKAELEAQIAELGG